MPETDQTYPLDSQKVYTSMDYLTLPLPDGGELTLRVGAWLNEDPVRIHQMIIREKSLQVDQYEVLAPLQSKLRHADFEYYKRWMGLGMTVDYPGYPAGTVAKIPFENDPVGFYKWWRKGHHEDKVHLSRINLFRLVQKVSLMDSKILLRKDLDIIK